MMTRMRIRTWMIRDYGTAGASPQALQGVAATRRKVSLQPIRRLQITNDSEVGGTRAAGRTGPLHHRRHLGLGGIVLLRAVTGGPSFDEFFWAKQGSDFMEKAADDVRR